MMMMTPFDMTFSTLYKKVPWYQTVMECHLDIYKLYWIISV